MRTRESVLIADVDALQRSKDERKPWEEKITIQDFLNNSRQDERKVQAALDVAASQLAMPHNLRYRSRITVPEC